MIHSITNLLKRTSFVLVATLIVAVHPAVASADTNGDPSVTPTTQTQTSDTTPIAGSTSTPSADITPTDTNPPAADNSVVPKATNAAPTPASDTTAANTQTDAKTTTNNTAAVTNTTTSTAKSGDATVSNNDHAGNATSGKATVNSTTINNLQSSSSFNGSGNFATFNKDIDGNQVGDILLDPSIIAQLQVENNTTPTNLKVNNTSDTSVTNNITLNAQSGNATVDNNDNAGDATSGDANAVANIVNFVNSVVGANKTFVGVININGNLDGDILIPDEMKNLLTQQSTTAPTNLDVQNNTSTTIDNNIKTTATSGNATVNNNDNAGNATSGNASTNVTMLNLTGHEVTGADSIVVFVNVLGKWVGFIVDAPQGATVAALGSSVANDTATGNASISNTTSTTISNNVDVTATSGNATVSNNDHGGNATSGNATASANILNVTNSSLSMGGWFGILFINVFGSWNGSFGVDTAAGGFSTHPSQTDETTPPSNANAPQSTNNQTHQNAVLAAQASANSQNGSNDVSSTTSESAKHKGVLGASTSRTQPPSLQTNSNHWVMPAIGIGISALLFIGEILRSRRKARKMQFAANTVG